MFLTIRDSSLQIDVHHYLNKNIVAALIHIFNVKNFEISRDNETFKHFQVSEKIRRQCDDVETEKFCFFNFC